MASMTRGLERPFPPERHVVNRTYRRAVRQVTRTEADEIAIWRAISLPFVANRGRRCRIDLWVNISTTGGGSNSSETATSPQLASYARMRCADQKTILPLATVPHFAGPEPTAGRRDLLLHYDPLSPVTREGGRKWVELTIPSSDVMR
jgi:hypothetical protein